jgi:hypothetical protein
MQRQVPLDDVGVRPLFLTRHGNCTSRGQRLPDFAYAYWSSDKRDYRTDRDDQVCQQNQKNSKWLLEPLWPPNAEK